MDNATWQEALEDFLCRMEASKRAPKTVRFYSCQIRMMAAWAQDEEIKKQYLPLQEFKSRHFSQYMTHRSKVVSVGTMHHDIAAARLFFKFCRKQRYIAHDPLEDYEAPRPPKPIVKMPTQDELERLLRAIESKWDVRQNPQIRRQDAALRPFFRKRDYAIVCLLIESGCRIGEALNLRIPDVDIANMERAKVTFRETKTKKDREVPITSALVSALQPWLKTREETEKNKAGDIARGQEPRCGDHLFITIYGEPMKPSSFAKTFRAYLAYAKVERFTRHAIRHFTITKMVAKNPRSAQLLAGHANIATTMGYDHTAIEQVREDHAKANPLGSILVNKRSQAAKERRRVL